tara:strand:- start:230 stop:673 length:444 start_codon:yes stop_codon:yes gene_type:complete
MADLVWIHEDALRATHPVFDVATDGARAVFIWDSARFDAAFIGSKRQLFIYQTLIEMDVDIIAGQTAEILSSLVAAEDVNRLVVAETPNPAIHAALGTVRGNCPDLPIDNIAETPFVSLAAPPDLGRFFRYWNKAKKGALRHGGLPI